MVGFRTSSAFRGWVRVRVLGYGFGLRGRKAKSRDCALASDLVGAMNCGLYVFDSLQHKKEQKVQLGFDGRCNARPRYRYQNILNRPRLMIIIFEFHFTRCLRTLRALELEA